MPKFEGGFGSAGAGNRTGRTTWTATGRHQTAWTRNNAILDQESPRLDDPSPEELSESIRIGRCWWCGRDGFTFISSHWSQIHGIKPDYVRNILMLPRHSSFLSPEFKAQRSATAKTLLAQGRIRLGSTGAMRKPKLTAYGERYQAVKTARLQNLTLAQRQECARRSRETRIANLGVDGYLAQLRAMAKKGRAAQQIPRTCVVCGESFLLRTSSTHGQGARKTCYSGPCEKAYRRQCFKPHQQIIDSVKALAQTEPHT